jgi:carbonic anhydrase/acetyltransferase-like protein (isoleucine patch superfamily)
MSLTLNTLTQPDTTTTTDITTTQSSVVENLPAQEKKIRKKRAPKHDFKDGFGRVFAHRHTNGNGWVSDAAKVAETVYVGPRCHVAGRAIVENNVRLEGHAKIGGCANVRDAVVLRQRAHIYDRATVVGGTILADFTAVYGNARVGGGQSELSGYTHVFGDAVVLDSRIHGATAIFGEALIARSTLRGWGVKMSGPPRDNNRFNITRINNDPCLCVLNLANVLDSQIEGAGLIFNRAAIVKSTLRAPSRDQWFEIFDAAAILNESNITVNFKICGHTIISRSHINTIGMTVSPMSEPVTINGVRALVSVSAGTDDEYRRYIANSGQQVPAPVMPTYAPPAPPPMMPANNSAVSPAGPIQIPGFSARRIIRTD